jgi:soluble lytic murein transglycosylase
MNKQSQNIKKSVLVWFIIITIILIILAGGYLFIKDRFPLDYEDTIVRYAKVNDLDPYFVCAVIVTESRFDAEAESHKGAIGLMQIMPDTGEWIAGKLKIKEYDVEMLKDPEMNIRMGTWYLHYLSDRFGKDTDNMTAAYNAGPNKVSEWLENEDHSSDGTSLDSIPYEETQKYVSKVAKAYDIYKAFYQLG